MDAHNYYITSNTAITVFSLHISIMLCYAKSVAIFFFFVSIQLKPTDSTIKPTVTFEYHLLVQASHEETATSLSNNTTYHWTRGEFGTCSVICGGGKPS